MKTSTIMIRISEQDKARWTEAAEKRGMTLSEYIRFIVNMEVERAKAE